MFVISGNALMHTFGTDWHFSWVTIDECAECGPDLAAEVPYPGR